MDTVTRAGEHCDRIISQEARADALRLTKLYLEGFRSQEQYVRNLAEDIADKYVTSITPMYGEHIGHSSITKLELGAKLADNEQHQQTKIDYTKAKRILERLSVAIERLPRAERIILQERYINPMSSPWDYIAGLVGYEKRNCQYLNNKGVRNVAVHLFGIEEVLKAEKTKRDNYRS